MNRNAFLAIAAIALSGCSTSRPQSSCQPTQRTNAASRQRSVIH